MAKIYTKAKNRSYKKLLGLFLIVCGAFVFLYTFFPLLSWQIFFSGAFASAKIDSPIPLSGLLSNSANIFGKDYNDANSWYSQSIANQNKKVSYSLSIPKIEIYNAKVSNKDSDLTTHLVQYNGDNFPGENGNAVIFGHSTLPQWFDPEKYTTIFSNLYQLKVNDTIDIRYAGKHYSYKIEKVLVVDADDTGVLSQDFSGSYITLITCTPPGTVWKRLVIKAKLQQV